MDFFAAQDRARSNSTLLVALFGVAAVATAAAMTGVVYLVMLTTWMKTTPVGMQAQFPFEPGALVILGIFGSICLGLGLASLWRMIGLGQNAGVSIARSLGGRPVSPGTDDEHERRLLNVVEEMALAAGIPVPTVFVLETGMINAFAAGSSPQSAVVGVTEGAMRGLTRDELQGVVAHEFSHIIYGDMAINVRMIGVLYGILFIAQAGRGLMQAARGSRKEGAPVLLAGFGIFLVGSIGHLFGAIIKSALSRQREYLADASAIQFTRNPDGIAGALAKAGDAGTVLGISGCEEVSHMFFANGVSGMFAEWFSTHPALSERLRRINPNFVHNRARKVPGQSRLERDDSESTEAFGELDAIAGMAAMAPVAPAGSSGARRKSAQDATSPPPQVLGRRNVAATTFIQSAGLPAKAGLKSASVFIRDLPEAVKSAVRDPISAQAAALCTFMSTDPNHLSRQLAVLEPLVSGELFSKAKALLGDVADLGPGARLPVIDLAVPSLRQLTADEVKHFAVACRALADADDVVEPFEFALLKVLESYLRPKNAAVRGSRRISTSEASTTLIQMVAFTGANPARAAEATKRGLAVLGMGDVEPSEFHWNAARLEESLKQLDLLSFAHKKTLLDACVQTAAVDGEISLVEAELLRAVGDALRCPIPAFA